MGADDWSRRQFVRGAAGAALLASLVKLPSASTADYAAAGLTLYDPRFATSQAIASRWGQATLRAIQGDPTELALRLAGHSRAAPLRIRGVTTEVVPFCLASLIAGTQLTQRRIDRDLFVWMLERRV